MVNEVLREVPRLWDFPRDSSQHDSPKDFHMMSFFSHPLLVKRDFLQPMDSLGSIMGNNKGHGNLIMVELNPNILVWHVQRMHSAWCKVCDVNCLLHSGHWALSTRPCPKAPLVMKQLLPPIFLFHLV